LHPIGPSEIARSSSQTIVSVSWGWIIRQPKSIDEMVGTGHGFPQLPLVEVVTSFTTAPSNHAV
jgi:hypothetical protein